MLQCEYWNKLFVNIYKKQNIFAWLENDLKAECVQPVQPAGPGVKSQIEDKWPRLNFQMDHFFVHYDPSLAIPDIVAAEHWAVVMLAPGWDNTLVHANISNNKYPE